MIVENIPIINMNLEINVIKMIVQLIQLGQIMKQTVFITVNQFVLKINLLK